MPSCRASDPYGMCLICSVCRQFLTNFCRLIVCACIVMPAPSARVRHCAASLGSFLRPSLMPRTLIRYRAFRSRIFWPDDLDRQIYPSCGAKFIAPPVYQRQPARSAVHLGEPSDTVSARALRRDSGVEHPNGTPPILVKQTMQHSRSDSMVR